MAPPWANLTAKFQDVIDEIRALKLEQQATNLKLDALIAKDYTIAGDVIADMLGVETRLDAIKAALVGTSPDPTDIRTAIWGLAGPAPGRTLADLHAALIGTGTDATDIRQAIWNLAGPAPGVSLAQLYALWVPTGDDLRPYGHLSNIALDMLLMRQILADYKDSFGDRGAGMTLYNMLDAMHTNVSGILQDADAINTAIGGSPYQSLELTSVRGLLNALRQCACAKNDGPPLIGDDAVCADPYESVSMVVVPWELIGGTSVMFAVWPDPPPSGLEYGSIFGIGEDHAELECDDWSDWRVWVASEADQFAWDSGVNRYPTNQWVEMSGSGSRSFSVDSRYGLSVTLCGSTTVDVPASPLQSGSCLDLLSTSISHGGSDSRQGIIWPSNWPKNSNNTGLGFETTPGGYVLQCELGGHTCEKVAGDSGNVIIRYSDSIDGGWDYALITTTTFTLPANTVRLYVHRTDQNITSAFTLRLCRPVT